MSATVPKKMGKELLASHGCDFNRASILRRNLTRENNSICVENVTIGDSKEMTEAVRNQITTILYSTDMSCGKQSITILARSQSEQLGRTLNAYKPLLDIATVAKRQGDIS